MVAHFARNWWFNWQENSFPHDVSEFQIQTSPESWRLYSYVKDAAPCHFDNFCFLPVNACRAASFTVSLLWRGFAAIVLFHLPGNSRRLRSPDTTLNLITLGKGLYAAP